MPRSTEVTFTCACGSNFASTVYQVVNVTLEPQLLYRLLAGTLNVAVCPNCGREASSAQPFIYHDMTRGLFAYVSPQTEAAQEDREALLEHLRQVYTQAVQEADRMTQRPARRGEPPKPAVRRSKPYDDLQAKIEPEAPPMQVIFGTDQLVTLVDSLLEPDEKLGKVALTTQSASLGDRDRLRQIAERMADQMSCLVATEDEPDSYTVWVYGPKSRTSAIAQALNAPS